MRISKMIKPLAFLAVLGTLNILLSFLVEPAQGSSATMWEEYYQEKDFDMVFVGASMCSATFDPTIFNEKLGVKSINMGTPMQAIDQNISGLKTAFEEHDIKTVVIGMGFFVLQEDAVADAELTYEHARTKAKGGLEGFFESLEYTLSENVRGTEKSINYWFPWQYDKEDYSIDSMIKNVRSKLYMMSNDYKKEASKKGYRPYNGNLDYEKMWNTNSYYTYEQSLKAERLSLFEEMLEICRQNGADVIVVNTPHPAFDIVSCYEMYQTNDALVREVCLKYNVDYYDFSLAKPEIYEADEKDYYDYEHLNYEGSQKFCRMLSAFLERRAKGEEMDGYFYSVNEFFDLHGDLVKAWESVKMDK